MGSLAADQVPTVDQASRAVSACHIAASLVEPNFLSGTIRMFPEAVDDAGNQQLPVSIGSTNLEELQLECDDRLLTIAADSRGNLVPLSPTGTSLISGTWRRTGVRSGRATTFRLKLPPALTCEFKLVTEASVVVTSPDALVIAESRDTETTAWKILPNRTSELTLRCSGHAPGTREVAPTMSVIQEARVDSQRTGLQWTITVSELTRPALVGLRFSVPCAITGLTVDDIHQPVVSTDSGGPRSKINLSLEAGARRTIRIFASATAQQGGMQELPVLIPAREEGVETGHPLVLESAVIRVTIPPSQFVVDHELTGVYEKDITWASDGSLTLDLVQIAQQARVALQTVSTRAVVEDSVLVLTDPQSRAGTAVAYVSLTVKTGQVGRAEWSLPMNWRVTSVTELATDAPVLFRTATVPVDGRLGVEAYLRGPASTGESYMLRVQLQSTAITSRSTDIPDLVNASYRRQWDLVATHDADISPGEEIDSSDELELSPVAWVPEQELAGTRIFRRREADDSATVPQASAPDLFCTVDYSVSRDDQVVEEQLRLTLSSPGGVPETIRFRATAADLRIAGDGDAAPELSLSRFGEQNDRWRLSLNSLAGDNEVIVPLVVRRTLQPRMLATTVSVEQARITGGSVQPPAAKTGFVMEVAGVSAPVTETVPYLDVNQGDIVLQRDRSGFGQQRISATMLQIVTASSSDRFHSECLGRVLIDSAGGTADFAMRIPGAERVDTFVNGVPSHPERKGATLTVPLNPCLSRNVVDVHFFSSSPSLDQLRLATVEWGGQTRASTHQTLLLPRGFELAGVPADDGLFVRSPRTVAERAADLYGPASQTPPGPVAVDFQSRWKMAAMTATEALTVPTSSGITQVSMQKVGTDDVMTFTYGILFCIVGAALRRQLRDVSLVVASLCLIVAASLRLIQPAFMSSFLNGLMISILFLGLVEAVSQRWFRSRRLPVARSLTVGICLTFTTDSVLGDEVHSVSVLNDEAWVVSCDVALTLESQRSALAVITCEVAVGSPAENYLPLPLDGLTLVDCRIDGEVALPRRSATGGAELVTHVSEGIAELPLTRTLQTVIYRVRTAPQWSRGRGVIEVAHPAAPVTRMDFTDATLSVKTARYRDAVDNVESEKLGQWRFPQRYGSQSLEIELELDAGEPEPNALQTQSVAVVSCEAEVSPGQVRLVASYSLQPASGTLGDVRIGYDSRYRITSVENADGEPLSWVQEDGFIRTAAPAGNDGIQVIRVRMVKESSVSLRQFVPTDRLRVIDGLHTQSMDMTVRTTDRFFVAEIVPDLSNGQTDDVPALEPGDVFTLGADTDSVRVQIQPRESGREVQIRQTCVVHEDHVAWTCNCRMDISGQPLYRQSIRVPPNVRVSDVLAETAGVSRIRTWTQDDRGVVVALREATRGVLDIRLQGELMRDLDSDTDLPRVQLNDAQILESSMKLSAATDVEAWIHDLGSMVPDDVIDVQNDSVPTNGLRLTVEDESRPLVIRARPQRQLVADVVVFIYEFGDQPLLCQLVAVEMPAARFAPRFRVRNDGFPAVNPAAFRQNVPLSVAFDNDAYFISKPSLDEQTKTVFVLPHLIPPDAAQVVSVSVPDVNADLVIRSHRVFDLRQAANAADRKTLPEWTLVPASDSDVIEDESSGVELNHDYRANSRRLRIRIRKGGSPTGPANQAVAAIGTHLLTGTTQQCVTGQSDFMVFCREQNPTINLVLSPDVVVTDLRVNGTAQLRGVHGVTPEIQGINRINHVSMKWLHPNPAADGDITLPDIANTLSESAAMIERPSGFQPLWDVGNRVLTNAVYLDQQAAGLRKGLRVLTGTQSTGASTGTVAVHGLDADFWKAVQAEAPQAAKSFSASIDVRDTFLRRGPMVVECNSRKVTISSPDFPEGLPVVALVAGCVALVLPGFRQKGNRRNRNNGSGNGGETAASERETTVISGTSG